MVGYTIITRIKLLVVISGSELRTGLTRFKQHLKSASFFKQFCPGFAIHKKLIMVIELSGVQFGLKSYA